MSDFYLQLWIYSKCWHMKIRGGSRIPHRRGHSSSGGATIQFCHIFQKKTSTVGYHETFHKSMSTKRAMLFTTALLKRNTLFKRIKTHYCTVCFHRNIQFQNHNNNLHNPSIRNCSSNHCPEHHSDPRHIIQCKIWLCKAREKHRLFGIVESLCMGSYKIHFNYA